jgi:hypothetical protein
VTRIDRPGVFRRLHSRRWLVVLGALLVLLVLGGALLTWLLERSGRRFFDTGRDAVETLGLLSAALGDADLATLESLYHPELDSMALGLPAAGAFDGEEPDRRIHGVRVYAFAPGPAVDRTRAVEEWRRYLAGFETVEEVVLHVHRLENWEDRDAIVATTRFELVGRPLGAPRAGIDRALLRLELVRWPSGSAPYVVRHAELVEGHRSIADEPWFDEVAASAGVDFRNRYYPAFFDTPLEFVMIRHGPAGITAADVDDDGWYDLFVPDGVESRLFRNRRDGTFEDVTEAAGLAGLSGVSVALVADYDQDGHRDLFVSRTFEPNQLFHNDGDGTFTDVTASSGIGADCCTTVASWADVDLDGDLDLYVGRYLDPRQDIPPTFYARNGEPNRLYRNDGDGTFTDVTDSAGVGDTGLCLGTAFGDYDGDGHPDLWVANDFGRKTLYRNRGDGTFEDVTVRTGTLAYGAGMSSSFGDYDNDGDLDLYVAHIRSEHAWFAERPTVGRYMANLFRQGTWRSDLPLYWEIFRQSGFRFVEVFQQMASGNTLLRNRGDGTFEDVTWEAGANPPGWFWGSGFADFDNDGWQDVYSTNGWIYGEPGTEIELEFLNRVVGDQQAYKRGELFDPDRFEGESWHGYERNRHLQNDGDGSFTEVGRAVGSDLLLNSRGIAVADFWNRGALDIAVAASDDRHALLRNRDPAGHHWIGIEVRGAGPSRPDGTNVEGVGARVTLRAGGMTQMREVTLGDGYGSQNALRLHFGLGPATTIDEIAVLWPRSGAVQRFAGVAPDRVVRVEEGRDALVAAVLEGNGAD